MDQSSVDQRHEVSPDAFRQTCNVKEESIPKVVDEKPSVPLESPTGNVPSKTTVKAEAIRRACDLRDLNALVSYAASEGGLLQDELRRLACMYLHLGDSARLT